MDVVLNRNIVNSDSYELKIISQDEISKGKNLKKYKIDNENVIGVYENEPFLIQFVNKTWNRVALKLSIDGTNIIDGSLANTIPEGNMWIVQPYGTLELKAFPETNKGGAQFIFGKPEDSVAVNTHGVKSGIGYIAVAVFVENNSQPIMWNNPCVPNGQVSIPLDITWTTGTTFIPNTTITYPATITHPITTNTINTLETLETLSKGQKGEQQIYNVNSCCAIPGPAVGAGEYVNQEITKVAGLTNPILGTILTIKYEWWVSLRSKIRKMKNVNANPAFPGDQAVTKMIDLKTTPRKKKNKSFDKYPELNRFD